MDEVRVLYPDANIYVQEDVPLLLLGNSHQRESSQREVVAVSSYDLISKIDGGGW